jgi:hypothetical protein
MGTKTPAEAQAMTVSTVEAEVTECWSSYQ